MFAARRGRVTRLLLIGLSVVGLAFPGSAVASIVLGKSIDGVTLGESTAAVAHHLGKPSSVTCSLASPFCLPGVKYWNYDATQTRFPLSLQVFFLRGKVQAVTTYSNHQRTSRGIGPGVSVARLKQTYTRGKVAPYSGSQGWWLPGPPENGQPFTVFVGSARTTLAGKVSFVEIGRWLNKYTCEFYGC